MEQTPIYHQEIVFYISFTTRNPKNIPKNIFLVNNKSPRIGTTTPNQLRVAHHCCKIRSPWVPGPRWQITMATDGAFLVPHDGVENTKRLDKMKWTSSWVHLVRWIYRYSIDMSRELDAWMTSTSDFHVHMSPDLSKWCLGLGSDIDSNIDFGIGSTTSNTVFSITRLDQIEIHRIEDLYPPLIGRLSYPKNLQIVILYP